MLTQRVLLCGSSARARALALLSLSACAAGAPASEPPERTETSGAVSASNGDAAEPPAPAPARAGESSGPAALFSEDDLAAVDDGCDNVLPIVVRDFRESHPDFEMAFSGDEPRLHLVEPTLGADGKPVFLEGVGCPRARENPRECNPGFHPTQPVITSGESFDQWYRSVDGVNLEFERELTLEETAPGSGIYAFQSNAFFPLEPSEGFGETPPGQGRNFLFTTEIRTRFTYVAGQVFTFDGDDDLWIFVNGRLALDLGGMHGQRDASIDFDAQAQELGIVVGGDYTLDVFHAERHTSQSNFRMETTIACFTPGAIR